MQSKPSYYNEIDEATEQALNPDHVDENTNNSNSNENTNNNNSNTDEKDINVEKDEEEEEEEDDKRKIKKRNYPKLCISYESISVINFKLVHEVSLVLLLKMTIVIMLLPQAMPHVNMTSNFAFQ